jgi:Glycerol-3-phosphate dehydrogenase
MSHLFSAKEREQYLEQMAENELDVLVIGGGITGAGIAWDASVRGMKTGLLEMNDFASGTSSRSTKLIHGGLRYLKQGEVKLVREVGKERALLHKSAPHLVEPVPMLLPIYKRGTYGYWASSIGLYIYDWLAGVKRGERRTMHGREETMAMEPLFKRDGLKGSGYYYEYRTDDARLTMEVLKSARAKGACIVNYAMAQQFIYAGGKAAGVRAVDRSTGKTYDIYARKIVNAAGPWVDEVRKRDNSLKGKRLLLTKGVHLVVDYAKLPVRQAAYFDVPGGRMIFVIPRAGKTYIGTTDTVYEGELEEPGITAEDRDYLLQAVNAAFPAVKLQASDIESGWSGLRPLLWEEGKSPSEISRKDELFVSDSGLVTIAGGKLTGFRKMAEKVVNLIAAQLQEETGTIYPPCTTDREAISGGSAQGKSYEEAVEAVIAEGAARGVGRAETLDLIGRYGTNTTQVLSYMAMSERDAAGLKLLYGEIRYCVEHEMTKDAADFLLRRTGWMLFDRQRAERLTADVLEIMGVMLAWDGDEAERQQELVKRRLREVSVSSGEA